MGVGSAAGVVNNCVDGTKQLISGGKVRGKNQPQGHYGGSLTTTCLHGNSDSDDMEI